MQHVAARDQVVDPFGEPVMDVVQGGGESLGFGVEQVTDPGQRHARGGQVRAWTSRSRSSDL